MGLLDYVTHRTRDTQSSMRARVLRGDIPPWIANRGRNRYIAQVVISTPPWVCREDLRLIKAWGKAMTVFTSQQHDVGHIIPLNHPRVCGLTVPWNLEVMPARRNAAMTNHFLPEQMGLFE